MIDIPIKDANRILQDLHEIARLAEWHCDDHADIKDQSPTDQVAHVNGLIRQLAFACIAYIRRAPQEPT